VVPARLGGDSESSDVGVVTEKMKTLLPYPAKSLSGEAVNAVAQTDASKSISFIPKQETFATKVVASVVNSPSQAPDGIAIKDIPIR
jgi:hypothetical protein